MATIPPFPFPCSTKTGLTLIMALAGIGIVGSHRNHRCLQQRPESTASRTIILCSASHGMLPPLISSELIGFSLESFLFQLILLINSDAMNNIRGYGFRPSDEELIRYLEDVAFDRDSLVQYITRLEDICKFDPWELVGLSRLQHPGCRVWYFMYPLNHKYRRGEQINRVTKEGYWKPTGRRRKVIVSDTKAEIGSKRTLSFHGGRPESKKSNTKSDNKKNKTKNGSYNRKKAVWVMHEFQLNTATPSNQKTYFLGKLMKQSEEAASSSDSSKPLMEVEASSSNEQGNYAQTDENVVSNQPNIVAEIESSNLPASSGNDSMDLSDCELCNVDELLAMMKTPDN